MKYSLLLSIIFLGVYFLHSQDTSQDEFTGSWTAGATWLDGGAPANDDMVEDVTIDGYITLSARLDLSAGGGNQTLTINEGDTLVIDSGNTSRFFSGNTVNCDGLMIVTGNLNVNGGTSFTVGSTGVLVVGGTMNGFAGVTMENNGEIFVADDSDEFGAVITAEVNDGSLTGLTNINSYLSANSEVLPVELVTLEATLEEGSTGAIKWSTAAELNNLGFFVEKSEDGLDFESLGFVFGNNTTSTINSYIFYDEDLVRSSYYRLKQVDHDGSFNYSHIIYLSLINLDQENVVTIYPNPFISDLTIDGFLNEYFAVTVNDLLGRTLYRNDQVQLNAVSNDLKSIFQDQPRGLYIVSFSHPNYQKSFRLFKDL